MVSALCNLFATSCSLGAASFLGNTGGLEQRAGLSLTARAPLVVEAKVKWWYKANVNKNGKLEPQKMHVKAGDRVIVIRGKDKGKVTQVVKAVPKKGQIVCSDVNIKTDHVRTNEGTRIEIKEFPIHHSNVMHWSEKGQCRSRIRRVVNADGSKSRVLKKTGEVLPEPEMTLSNYKS